MAHFTSHDALEYFDVGIDIGLNFLVLFGMFVVFRTCAYLALRFIKNSDRSYIIMNYTFFFKCIV